MKITIRWKGSRKHLEVMVLPDSLSFSCQHTSFLQVVLCNNKRNEHQVVYSNYLDGVGLIKCLTPDGRVNLIIWI